MEKMSEELNYYDILQSYFSYNMTNKLELKIILASIDSLEILDQSVIGSFWVAPTEKQIEFLSFLKREVVMELLKSGLNGATRQAVVALTLLKESFHEFIDVLKEDILAAASGDSMKICAEAGTLLLKEKPEFVNQRPWFLKRLTSIAEAPVPVAERLPLIILLCEQANSFNFLQIEHYPDRDEVAGELLSEKHHLPLALYLRAAMTRWDPVNGEPANLVWLVKTYTELRNSPEDNDDELTLKGQQKVFSIRSKFILESALYETAAAGADAIIRCINGPGGEHLWGKFSEYMSDKDLAEELLLSLSRDPRALAILAEDMLLSTEDFNISNTVAVQFLSYGVLAAQHCLQEILRLGLSVALPDQEARKLFIEKIEQDKDKLYPYAKDLFEKTESVTAQ